MNFNEPLSLLQRMMEEIYYADLLSQAAQTDTTLDELTYLAAFVLSAYSHTIYRVGKPFNPLLGETYECDRRAECGWRCFMEQVSHGKLLTRQYTSIGGWGCAIATLGESREVHVLIIFHVHTFR